MYIELFDLFLLLLVGLVLLAWYRGLQARERALREVQKYCERMDLQLLDQTVALRSIWFRRNPQGRLCLLRRYRFEFATTGDERYFGQVILAGQQLEAIHAEAHRIS